MSKSKEDFEWKLLWRGHLLLFDKTPGPTYSVESGGKLLWVFVIVGLLMDPLWIFARSTLHLRGTEWQKLGPPSLLAVSAVLVWRFARVPFTELGLRRWARWSTTERLYFLQIVPLASIAFAVVFSSNLASLWRDRGVIQIIFLSILPGLLWGFCQEFLYRGILQTELVRRWGTVGGVLASNALYTFGPLHFYHFRLAKNNPEHLWIFAAIFGMGMIFSAIYHRSRNLWIIGVMHGLWPLNFM